MNPWMFDAFLATLEQLIGVAWDPLSASALWLAATLSAAMLLLMSPFLATIPDATHRLFWGFLRALVWIWAITHLRILVDGFSNAMMLGGLLIGGNRISLGQFTSPGAIFEQGYNLWEPVLRYTEQSSATWYGALMSIPMLILYTPVWFMGMLCYFIVCVHITMALIEFELVTIFALLLLPWAMMPGFAFMAEGAIASIVAVSVRLSALAAITSLGLPLVQSFQLTATGDPGYYQLTKTLVACGIFALLSWIGPGIAGSMVSGTPSGLGSSALVVGAAFTGGVVRGVSQVSSRIHLPARRPTTP